MELVRLARKEGCSLGDWRHQESLGHQDAEDHLDTNPQTLYLVDGTSQLYRAYFAIGGLTSPEGLPTNAVYGFTTMLRKLIDEEQPPYLGVAFDVKGPVFRHERYAAYKANRPPTPEDLRVQVPYAKQVCEVLGIPVLEQKGFEADDLIATHAAQARALGFEVVVVASDKDLLQLVGEGVSVLNPSKNLRLDAAGVVESFGVPPQRVRDVLALMGDAVDNVPGVPGVGRKTALGAVETYGELETVIARAEAFVSAYDARDDWLVSLDGALAQADLSAGAAKQLVAVGESLASSLRTLIDAEHDPKLRDRLEEAHALLAQAELRAIAERVGENARHVLKPLAPVKKAMKGLDRGSSKRSWYAIAEHAEQGRLSKELVTLDSEVPVRFDTERFAHGPADPAPMRALFESLGFTTLLPGLDHAPAPPAGAPAPVAVETIVRGERLDAIVEALREAGRVALVAVGDGPDPQRADLVGVGLAWAGREPAYVPLGHHYLGVPDQLAIERLRRTLGPLLADASVEKVGHDLKRTAHLLRRAGMPVEGWSLDTMVAAFLLNSSRSHYGLDSLAREFLGREPVATNEEGRANKKRKPTEIEVETAAVRAGGAAEATLALGDAFPGRLRDAGLGDVYDRIDGPLLPLLARMEMHGIRVETALLEGMSQEMRAGLERARGEIHELAGEEFNIDSPKQLRQILFEKLGLKPRRKTAKSKAASTDAQTLEELAAEHAIAGKIQEYRELAKLKSTYVDALPGLVHPDTGRVHTCYHPTGAATGRLSSSDPNLQNIPVRREAGRKIREAFVAADGFVFLAADYSQIELRVLAHMADDPDLIAAFESGEDIHRHTAARVFEVLPGLVTDAMRRRAKAINFGILYGMSEMRLAREQGMTRAEAQRFIQAYFRRFSRVQGYIEAVREQAQRDGAVRTLFGRVRLFPQLHQQVNRAVREQALRAAVNTTLQGTAADLMKLAMLAVDRELAGSGARMLLQVHDEILLEVPAAAADELAGRVKRSMEEVHPLAVPLVVDQKTGENWLEVT